MLVQIAATSCQLPHCCKFGRNVRNQYQCSLEVYVSWDIQLTVDTWSKFLPIATFSFPLCILVSKCSFLCNPVQCYSHLQFATHAYFSSFELKKKFSSSELIFCHNFFCRMQQNIEHKREESASENISILRQMRNYVWQKFKIIFGRYIKLYWAEI